MKIQAHTPEGDIMIEKDPDPVEIRLLALEQKVASLENK